MAAVKLAPATLWLAAYKVVREECVIMRAGVKSVTARPRKADNVIWMSHLAECMRRTRCARACVCEGEQETDSANSFTSRMLLDLCMMLFLSVCLCAKAECLSERLPPWWRLMNSGGHGGRRLSHPLQSLLSNEAGPQHASSFQQPRLNASCGSLLEVRAFGFWKVKLIYFPLYSLSNLHGSSWITWDCTRVNRQQKAVFQSCPRMPAWARWMRAKRRREGSFILIRHGHRFPKFILAQLYKKNQKLISFYHETTP